jgi:hypothetical protein
MKLIGYEIITSVGILHLEYDFLKASVYEIIFILNFFSFYLNSGDLSYFLYRDLLHQ